MLLRKGLSITFEPKPFVSPLDKAKYLSTTPVSLLIDTKKVVPSLYPDTDILKI